MSITEILIRFVIGGTIVVLVGLIGNSNMKYVSGIIVLFPAITAVGYYFLSKKIPSYELKSVVLTSMFTLPTTLIFLGCLYFTIDKLNIRQSLAISILGWLLSAVIYVILKEKI